MKILCGKAGVTPRTSWRVARLPVPLRQTDDTANGGYVLALNVPGQVCSVHAAVLIRGCDVNAVWRS